jgi:hypothetical protein
MIFPPAFSFLRRAVPGASSLPPSSIEVKDGRSFTYIPHTSSWNCAWVHGQFYIDTFAFTKTILNFEGGYEMQKKFYKELAIVILHYESKTQVKIVYLYRQQQ